MNRKINLYGENEAEQEDYELIESEIARLTDEIDEKEQLPILIK